MNQNLDYSPMDTYLRSILEKQYGYNGTGSNCEYIEQLYEENEEREFVRNYIANMYGFFDYGLLLYF